MRVVIGHRVFPETLERLRPYADIIAPADDADRLDPRALRDALTTADAWMAFMPDSVDADVLARAPRLRLIAAALKGADNLDLAACTRAGVALSIVPDLLTVPTAELTIGLIIALARHVRAGDAWVRSGAYRGWEPRFYGAGLAGATVGIVGAGAIGRAIAARLRAFGVRQRYHDVAPLDASEEARSGFDGAMALDDLLAWAQIVVLAAPLTPSSRHLLDAARLARMQPSALLVNPARGSLVDEAAVADALDRGQLGGYAADAFAMEDWALADRPTRIEPRLLAHANTLFTPHLGSAVADIRCAIERRAAENIIDLAEGRTPRDRVNVPDRPRPATTT